MFFYDDAKRPLAALKLIESTCCRVTGFCLRRWRLPLLALKRTWRRCPANVRFRGVKRTLVELSEKLGSVKFTKFCKVLFAPTKSRGLIVVQSSTAPRRQIECHLEPARRWPCSLPNRWMWKMSTDLTFANSPERERPPKPNQQSQPRHRNIYDCDGEYEFPTVQHWTAPDVSRS
jgi:hypothetical protein